MTVKPFSRLNYNSRNFNVVAATMVPVYSVSASSSSINEGTAVTYTITTQYVLDGTILYWTTSGTTVAADFTDGVTSGSVTMADGTATVVRTLTSDITTEGAETIVFELRTVSTSGTIVASTPSGTVNDTSVLTITPDVSSINEGATVTWTINAIGFGTGTLYYTNSGTTSAGDFSDGLNSGSIAITADSGTLTKTLQLDLSTEGSETIIIQIRTSSTSGTIVGTSNTVTVADTSYSTQAYSVKFNGTNQYLSITSTAISNFGTGDFTVEGWFYTNSISTLQGVYDGRPLGTSTGAYPSVFIETSTLKWYTNAGTQIASSTLLSNTWYHFAFVRISGSTKMYINGTQAGSTYTDATTYVNGASTIGYLGGNSAYPFNGYISNFRIVKGTGVYTANFNPPTDNLAAITGTSLLINGATIADSSSNAFTITNTGTAVVSMENPFGDYSMSFDGSSQYLTTASSVAATGDFTVECWVYATAYTTNMGIWSIGSTEASGRYELYLTTSYTLTLDQFSVGGPTWGVITANAWNHIALVRYGTTLSLYVNGVPRSVTSGSATLSGTIGGTNGYVIGKTTYASNAPWSGYISNFRYVNGSALYPWIPATTALTTTSQNATASQVSLLTAQSATIVNNGASSNITYIPSSTYAALFNSSFLYVTGSLNFAFDAGNFTMEAWVYQTASANPGIATTWNGGGAWTFGLSSNYLTFMWTNAPSGTSSSSVTGTTQQVTLNAWNHVAVVRNGTTITLYVNGVADATTFNVGTDTNYYYNGVLKDLRIGIGGDGGNPFPGYISNFRIVKGTAVYTSNFTPSGPLTNITNTILLTLQNATFVDNSSSLYTVNASSMTTTSIGTFPLSITNGGTVTAGNSVIPFAGTYSYQFNGTNQYLYIPININLIFDTGDFTVEFWYYMTSYGSSNQQLIDFRGTGTDTLNMAIYLENVAGTGTKQLRFFAANADRAVTASNFTLNAWVHVALVRTGGFTRFFTNGQQVGSTYTDGNSYTIPAGLCIGSYRNISAFLNGYISNLRIVKGNALYAANFTPSNSSLTAITNTQLLTCQYAELIDASANKLAITNTGSTPASTQNPFGNYANDFTGTAQYLTLPRTAGALTTGPFTIECWVRPRAYAAGTIILNNGFWNGGYNGAWQLMFNANGTVWIQLSNGTYNTYPTLLTSTVTVTLNVWTHIAVVRNASNIVQLYINGVGLASPPTSSASWSTAYGSSTYWFTSIGSANSDGTWGQLLNGQVTNVRIVNGTAVYTGNFTPQTTPLALTQSAGTTNIAAITSGTQLLTCQYDIPVDVSPYSWAVTNNGSTNRYLTDIFTGIVSGVNYAQKNYSLKLNTTSTNQYLTTTHASNFAFGTGDFTIESWIYLDNSYKSLSLESVATVLWFGDSGSNSAGIFAQMGSDRLSIARPGYATNVRLRYPGATTGTPYLQYNTWYHLAVTRQSATWKIFLNGVQGTTDSAADYSINTTSVAIGGTTTASFGFPGYISNMRVVKGVAVYTGAFTPSTTPLKAAQSSGTNIAAITTQTSLLTCQYNTLFDASNNKLALTRTGNADMAPVYPFPV
jgi:Concanavalin A-like lectin/glucanases superfamily